MEAGNDNGIVFYITFEEFKQNYKYNLNKWLDINSDATENDFKDWYLQFYSEFYKQDNTGKVYYFFSGIQGYQENNNWRGEYDIKYSDVYDLAEYLNNRKNRTIKDNETVTEWLKNRDLRFTLQGRNKVIFYLNDAEVIAEVYRKLRMFLKIDQNGRICVDERLYVNFEHYVLDIVNFLLDNGGNMLQKGAIQIKDIRELYDNPLLPRIIKEACSSWGDFFYNLQLKLKGVDSAFTNQKHFDRFLNEIPKDKQGRLIEDYVKGFAKGYLSFVYENEYQTANIAIGDFYYGFRSASFYKTVRDIDKKEIKKREETYTKGVKNGKRYKAMEIILKDATKYELYFNEFNRILNEFEKYKKEKNSPQQKGINTTLNDTMKFNILPTELVELVKALYENGTIKGKQKDLYNYFAKCFDVEVKNPNKLLQDIKNRNNGSETLFLNNLKTSLFDYMTKENRR